MAEELILPKGLSKQQSYELLIPQIKSLMEGEPDLVANLANTVAALKYGLDFFWVGIYRVKNDSGKEVLVLGPFQGPVACTRIAFAKGVCGKAWEEKKTILVDDVEQFPGHIACSSLSRSEIVVPIIKNNQVLAVLDVDSTELSDFDLTDKKYLEEICVILSGIL